MNRLTKLMACLLIGLFLANGDVLLNEAAAQGPGIYRDPTGHVTLNGGSFESRDGFTRQVPFGTLSRVYTQVGDGVGWNDGQTFFSVFHPFHITPWVDLVFVDVRGYAAYNNLGDGLGANLGVGYRRYVQPWNTIFGISAWGDIDGAHNKSYYQAGVSGEIITPVMEYRVNGYIGLGRMTNVLSQGTAFNRPFFQQYFAYVNNYKVTENLYQGVDAELGGPVPYLGRRGVNGYVGGYWLTNHAAGSTAGVKLRGQIFVHEDVQLGLEYRYDDLFRSSFWGNIMFQFPNSWRDWFRKPFFLPRSPAQHLAQQVQRDYRGHVKQRTDLTRELLLDPTDGSPLIILHVNPDGPPGDGSYEHPFSAGNFANRSDANIIRVLPGNFGLDRTLNLYDNQRLLAANHQHYFYGLANGQLARMVLPGQVVGPNPTITNSVGADVIRLANNTEVSGFDILGLGRIGIIGDNISDFNINRVNIDQSLHGIQITNFHNSGLPAPFGQGNLIEDVRVTGSMMNGVALNLNDGGTGSVWINRLNSGGNNDHGLSISATGNSNVNLLLTGSWLGDGNGLAANGEDGFNFAADSGTHTLIIGGDNVMDGNIFSGNVQRGADILLSGTAVASITAINNTFGVGGANGGLNIGTNFTASVFGGPNTSGIPPDTMGAVGPAHIVELINTKFAVYDKNGNLVTTMGLDAFWTAAGVTVPAGNFTFDPRIIYDPQSGRWYAAAIDSGAGNRIYVAVSNTSDPTQGWKAVQFAGDSTGNRFNDFDMLGINDQGIYIATNNFMGGSASDVSLYVIPKADLLAATPTLANLTRFENQPAGTIGFTPHPAQDTTGSAPNTGNFLSAASFSGATLTLTNTSGVGPATLQASINIAVAPYTAPNLGRQPGGNDNIEIGDGRLSGAPVRIGNSLWAVHNVQGPTGNSVIRWYEIDATTNAVKQTGTIADPNLDFYEPSIAVNSSGNVVIGFSGSGDNQPISTYAAVGRTNGGTTAFGTPTLLKQGNGTYFMDFGMGRNRWGDYSATVVDPINPSTFWTFQEFVNGTDTWAVQITQLRLGGVGNALDGLRVRLSDSAQVSSALFDRNNFNSNGGIGMHIEAHDTSLVNNTTISNNNFIGNVTGLMLTANDMSTINANVVGNTFTANTGPDTGLYALANSGTINLLSLINNSAISNSGNGFRLEAANGGLLTLANAFGNTATTNLMNGMLIRADGAGSRVYGSLGLPGQPINNFSNNTLAGLRIEAINDGTVADISGAGAFGLLSVNASGNGAGGLDALVNGTAGTGTMGLSINQSNFDSNADFGVRVHADGTGVMNALLLVASSITNTTDNAATTNPQDGAGEGILLVRSGSSIIGGGGGVNIGEAGFGNLIMSNAGDGLRVFGEGDHTAVNFINFASNQVLSNAGNGINIDQTADSVFLYSMRQNYLISSGMHGIKIATSNNAAIGNIYTFNLANPFASAAVFDGNTVVNSAMDGVNITTPLTNNESWQNIAFTGDTQRTLISGSGINGVTIVSTNTPTVDGVMPQQNFYTIRGADITTSTGDGMNISLLGGESALFPEHAATRPGTSTVNIGAVGQSVNVVDNVTDGVDILSNHQDMGIFNNTPTTVLIAGTDTINIDSVVSARNGGDGFEITQTGISDITFSMLRSAALNNGQTGLFVNITSANAANTAMLTDTTSVYNIGSDVAGSGNIFANNALQGVFFQTLSPVVSGPININPNGNTFLSADPQNPQVFLTSGLYADARFADTFTFTTARFNFFGNMVRDNGSAGNAADGVALSVGTNTRMFAAISQNMFSGNAGADLNIVNVVSQNPGASINNFMGANDLLASDPIGQLDLALGLNFVGVDPPVGGEVPSGALPNIGENFKISTIGITSSLAGRTELGIFTNNDLIKPANRNSFLLVRVYDANPSVLDQNVFPQSGSVITTLMNADIVVGGGGNLPGGPIPLFDTIQFVPLGTAFP